MGYYIDIEKMTLDDYKSILKESYMIPSRQMLKEDIDKNIDIFAVQGIENIAQLQKHLKSKPKLKKIAEKTGLGEKYLNALRLELNAYIEKPTKVKDFACLSDDIKSKLEGAGIKDTFDVYNRTLTKENRDSLAKELGLKIEEIVMITKLADLSRIRWVNHTFAYVLYLADYDTVEKAAKADYNKVYEDVRALNKEKQIFKGNIGLNDMKLLTELAGRMPMDIGY